MAKLIDVVRDRLRIMGTSQKSVAEEMKISAQQFGRFLKEEGRIDKESTEILLDIIGIDLLVYKRRTLLAIEIANTLLKLRFKCIDFLDKDDIFILTKGKYDLKYFIDVKSVEEYNYILEQGVIDPESTFVYFKALVAYIMILKKNIRLHLNMSVENEDEKITGRVALKSLRELLGRKDIKSDWYKHQGCFSLFSKEVKDSLNEKAREYASLKI